MYPMAENCHVILCIFCGTWTGPEDQNSMIDGAGILCGGCVHRLDLDGDLILPCGLCKMPILGATFVIIDENHDCEYCEHCYTFLCRAGFGRIR